MGPLDTIDGTPRQGVQRASQATNVLLTPSELGKVKRITTNLPHEDFAYGLPRPRDAEGAREVSMKWVEHRPNPDAKPGPDFKAMNKLAAIHEKTNSKEQRDFREHHPKTLKQGAVENKLKQKQPLPSDQNPHHTFGRQTSCRPVEETRLTGQAAHIKNVVQGTFMNDWVDMNERRADLFLAQNAKIPPQATKASSGHGAKAKAMQDQETKEPWKMKKFSAVTSKVGSFRASSPLAPVVS